MLVMFCRISVHFASELEAVMREGRGLDHLGFAVPEPMCGVLRMLPDTVQKTNVHMWAMFFRISVNFASELAAVMREGRGLDRLGFAVPEAAASVALQQPQLTHAVEGLTALLARYEQVQHAMLSWEIGKRYIFSPSLCVCARAHTRVPARTRVCVRAHVLNKRPIPGSTQDCTV